MPASHNMSMGNILFPTLPGLTSLQWCSLAGERCSILLLSCASCTCMGHGFHEACHLTVTSLLI